MPFSLPSPLPRSRVVQWLLAIILLAFPHSYALAQVHHFLQLQDIPGESTSAHHPKWIEILSFESTFLTSATPGVPAFSPIKVTKYLDRSSPTIAGFAASQKRIPAATIHATLQLKNEVVLQEIKLTNLTVQEYQQSAVQGGIIADYFLLTFDKISWSVTQVRGDGAAGRTSDYYWDLRTNQGGSTTNPSLTIDIEEASPTEWVVSWQATAGTTYQILAGRNVTGPYNVIDTVSTSTTGLQQRRFPKSPGILFFRVSTLP